jgi:uncharacterized protein (DUF2141 family)
MKYFSLIVIALLALALSGQSTAPTPAPVQTGSLRVIVRGFKNDLGKANIIMYKDAYTFPDKPDRSFHNIWTTIKNGVVDATFDNVPYGEYAFAAYHDENDNHRLDLSIIGIPKEGIAISNDAKGLFLPRFKDAKVILNIPNKTIVMNISY